MTPVYNANNQEVQRQKCEIYTRVMGYHRPVEFFNEGKKAEYYSRKNFKVEHSNDQFMADYACGCKRKGGCGEEDNN